MSTHKVGDTLWFKTHVRYRATEAVTITAVGTKWLTLSNGMRADKKTLALDSDGGELYPDEAAYLSENALFAAWGVLQNDMYRARKVHKSGVTIAAIDAARALLFPKEPGT